MCPERAWGPAAVRHKQQGLPEDLGQNPLSQLSCAAKQCPDARACGDLKYDNILQHKV